MVRSPISAASAALLAIVFVTADALAQSAAVPCGTDPPPAVTQAARQHFDTARSLVSGGAFDHAERELREALALYDSPNTHYWLGRALDGLGRTVDAFAAFDHTILLAARCTAVERNAGRQDRYAETVRLATEQRERLRATLSWVRLTVHAEEGADRVTVRVDGAALEGSELSRRITLRAGAHEIAIEANGHRPQSRRVELEGGQESAFTFELESSIPLCRRRPQGTRCAIPPPERPRPPPRSNTMLYAGVALLSTGAASGAAGVGLWFAARAEYTALDQACGQIGCDNGTAEQRQRAQSAQTIETVGLALGWGGVALSAVGATMIVIDRVGAARERARIAVTPSPRGLSITGTF